MMISPLKPAQRGIALLILFSLIWTLTGCKPAQPKSEPAPTQPPAAVQPTEIPPTDVPLPTPVPPTSTPAPTATPAGPARYEMLPGTVPVEFSPVTASTETPADILAEIQAPPPYGMEPTFCMSDVYPAPVLEIAQDKVEVFSIFNEFLTCGWKPEEDVSITLTLPDKTTRSDRVPAGSEPALGASYFLAPKLGDLLGKYTLVFQGKNDRLEKTFEVIPPTKRGISSLSISQILLYGFDPNETIRLFAYGMAEGSRTKMLLTGWKEEKVDANGMLLVNNSFENNMTVVLDSHGKVVTVGLSPMVEIVKRR